MRQYWPPNGILASEYPSEHEGAVSAVAGTDFSHLYPATPGPTKNLTGEYPAEHERVADAGTASVFEQDAPPLTGVNPSSHSGSPRLAVGAAPSDRVHFSTPSTGTTAYGGSRLGQLATRSPGVTGAESGRSHANPAPTALNAQECPSSGHTPDTSTIGSTSTGTVHEPDPPTLRPAARGVLLSERPPAPALRGLIGEVGVADTLSDI